MGYAFLSYSTKNQQAADRVRELFEKNNINIWMAPYSIPAGSKYAAAITGAIRNCDCFVLLLSNDSQASEAVDSEVELATLTFKKPIISVEIEPVELNDAFTFYIHNKQIIPLYTLDENSYDAKRVLDAVKLYTKSEEPVMPGVEPGFLDEVCSGLSEDIGDDAADEDLSNIVVLHDAEGNDVRFEFLDLIEYGGGEYVVLLPCDDDDGEVVILKVEDTGDGVTESYVAVDDEDVLYGVFEIFKNKFKDTFNFTD